MSKYTNDDPVSSVCTCTHLLALGYNYIILFYCFALTRKETAQETAQVCIYTPPKASGLPAPDQIMVSLLYIKEYIQPESKENKHDVSASIDSHGSLVHAILFQKLYRRGRQKVFVATRYWRFTTTVS